MMDATLPDRDERPDPWLDLGGHRDPQYVAAILVDRARRDLATEEQVTLEPETARLILAAARRGVRTNAEAAAAAELTLALSPRGDQQ